MEQYLSRSFGKTFHSIRTAQRKTIAQINLDISPSTIYNFENGKSDISLNNFLKLLTAVKIDIDDFFLLYLADKSDKQRNLFYPTKYFKQLINDLFIRSDPKMARQQYQIFKQAFEANGQIEDLLIAITIRAIELQLSSKSRLLSDADSQLIENYLTSKVGWYAFDYQLLMATAICLPSKSLLCIYQKMLSLRFSLDDDPSLHIDLVEALSSMAASFIQKSDKARSQKILTILHALAIPEEELLLKINITILDCVVKIKFESDSYYLEELSSILSFIKPIAPIFFTQTSDWLKHINIIT